MPVCHNFRYVLKNLDFWGKKHEMSYLGLGDGVRVELDLSKVVPCCHIFVIVGSGTSILWDQFNKTNYICNNKIFVNQQQWMRSIASYLFHLVFYKLSRDQGFEPRLRAIV